MDKRQRERNPITGDGMRAKDSQVHIPHMHQRPHQPSPMQYGSDDYYNDAASIASEEDMVAGDLPERPETAVSEEVETASEDVSDDPVTYATSLAETDGVPATLAGPPPPKAAPPRQPKQRERNPITGDGMCDRDYRATVPTFKTHGPQRKENNPATSLDSFERDDRAYRSHVAEAMSVTRGGGTEDDDPFPPPPAPVTQTVSRQRQRDRNPITGYGMEERDFRVQIPTFKIHGPQRQGGDPVTGTGYATTDKEYQRQVQNASNSPLSSPPSRN